MNRVYKEPKKTSLPWMFSESKRILFRDTCARAKGYFEYGCGGSTLAASKLLPSHSIVSIESDSNWISKVKNASPTVSITHINLGPISEYGYPATESEWSNWPTYSQAWTTLNHQADLVLIDGRFRVACLLWICLNPNSVKWIFFDDYKNRPQYFCVSEFIDILDNADDLIVCKPKQSIDIEKCKSLYEKFKNNPE